MSTGGSRDNPASWEAVQVAHQYHSNMLTDLHHMKDLRESEL